MKRLPLMAALVTCWGLPGATSAQSFNIDLDDASAPPIGGGGAPSAVFGAAAAQPGVWNAVYAGGPSIPVSLVSLSGTSTGGHLVAIGGIGSYGGDNFPGNTGDFALLLNDGAFVGGEIDYHFSGFAPGHYLIYTYAAKASVPAVTAVVTVPGAASPVQFVTGPMPGNAFILGQTHCIHDLILTGTSFEIDVSGGGPPNPEVTGFQIVAVPEPTTIVGFLAGCACRLRRRSL